MKNNQKRNKNKKKRKEKEKQPLSRIEPGTSWSPRLLFTTTLHRIYIHLRRKQYLKPFPWNFCRQTLFKDDQAVLITDSKITIFEENNQDFDGKKTQLKDGAH